MLVLKRGAKVINFFTLQTFFEENYNIFYVDTVNSKDIKQIALKIFSYILRPISLFPLYIYGI